MEQTLFLFVINLSVVVFIIYVSVRATNRESSARRNPASLFTYYFVAAYTAYSFPIQFRGETPSFVLVVGIGLCLGTIFSFFAISNREKENDRSDINQK